MDKPGYGYAAWDNWQCRCLGIYGVHLVHMADGQFAHMDAIFGEGEADAPDGVVFLNYDDERCRRVGGGRCMRGEIARGLRLLCMDLMTMRNSVRSEVKADRENLRFSVNMRDTETFRFRGANIISAPCFLLWDAVLFLACICVILLSA